MKIVKKIIFVVFIFCALGFAQVKTEPISKQDSTDLATIANQFNQQKQLLQEIQLKEMQVKSNLFDLQNEYNAKIEAIKKEKK